jgi:hypothetical protein
VPELICEKSKRARLNMHIVGMHSQLSPNSVTHIPRVVMLNRLVSVIVAVLVTKVTFLILYKIKQLFRLLETQP